MAAENFQKLSREMSGSSGIMGSLLLFVIIILIACLLVWASLTELDNVTRGSGKIVSSMENQIIQATEGGVIKNRYCEEGQLVEEGAILFEIDPIDAKTTYDQALQRLSNLKIQEIRLNAEVLGTDLIFPEHLISQSSPVVTGERALFAARKADLTVQLSVLNQQLLQRKQQIEEIRVNIQTARDTMLLIQQQISIIEPLVKSGLSPETELLSLKRQIEEFNGREKTAMATKVRIDSSIIEAEQQIDSAKQNYKTNSQSELSKIIAEITEIEFRIPALEMRVQRTQLRSPVKGVINRIVFKTLGGFVSPGDTVLEIVPTGDDLIVEAKIDPKDIAYIRSEQDVRISLTAYDASRYGTIDGKVITVSADAIDDKATGQSFYNVDVSIVSDLFEDDGSVVEILPGMVASVDVLAGKRTVLEYFWQPMAKVKERAFTD